uniref:Glycosyltransferase family 17 n=1 Tax=Marseillevirus LCMAC202 TaxID=2506606 RepID=A0A481YYY8_9VIRU|nr:MAG: glycosyltransferase family 17 [Marseillevirus LCMAC202]
MPRIIDAFIFYNELNMLEFRLTELADIVDHFVIIESTKTFAGKPKPLYFSQNTDRFSQFISKITHVIVQDMPAGNAWDREKHQRNCITRGVNLLKPTANDIIVISDADEIPDPVMLARFKREGLKGARRPVQDFYYYNLNCKGRVGNSRCRIMDYNTYKKNSPEVHTKSQYPAVPRGGWHFSYFGSEDFIINKIQQFSHQEFNKREYTNKNTIKQRVIDCADLFARAGHGGPHKFYYQALEGNNYLPKNYKMLLDFQNQNTRCTALKTK